MKIEFDSINNTLTISDVTVYTAKETTNRSCTAPIQDVILANAHKNACIAWEQMMMELVGEDGAASVRQAIELLKAQRDAAFGELKEIRDYVGANENESTFDEVVRLTTKKPQP